MGVCEEVPPRNFSGCEPPRQFAPAYFPAFVRRERLHEIDPFRHLPTAQTGAAIMEQFFFRRAFCRHHAGDNFLVAQGRGAAEDHGLPDLLVAQKMGFDLGWVHLFPGNIDHVGNPTNEPNSS